MDEKKPNEIGICSLNAKEGKKSDIINVDAGVSAVDKFPVKVVGNK